MQPIEKNDVKSTLKEKDGFHVWWRLLRPHTMTASFIPVFVGTMVASLEQSIDVLLFVAMLFASILIQVATNMFNEYYDYVRGLDNEQSVGIGGAIVRDGVAPKTVLTTAFSFYGVALLLGIYICMETSWWIAVIGAVCMLCGYLYTGGPFPISASPFGEFFAGLFMGTVIIGISYYIQIEAVSSKALLISIPVAIFIGTILLSNNIRDLKGDKENGRKTIAILVGHDAAVRLLATLFFLSFVITAVFIALGILPIWSLLTFLAIKKARDAYKGFIGKTMNIEMIPAMVSTAKTNTIYGFLLGISLIIQLIYPVSL
ncbi:1,4-dihydroxy-2-naphthoate polyprenyltransferase [Radiobacillus deserti]|uniref:1,4-dihydroxy-2-naphthoate octaprenyltransferase n=1 Tax=Radiobacillus deserti TaxID=2594883 RepID=A0A516KHT1_9BACI|nr:1,4-dihydroxy-2-naphthoate polyprenyltransferase [Radiobacillus deserti]QDP40941.1 1,4-dihydroxy-2-naphthoate polyprenyltransferase [Radiobacillus deserti]